MITPRIRGFICTTAHPEGCAANVRSLMDLARKNTSGKGLGTVLVIGSSTGFGLSSLVTAMFGYGADAVGVCFERAASADKTGTAGFYNLVEVHRQAAAAGRRLTTINGDAFSHSIKNQAVAAIKAIGKPIDLVIYSLASPKRKDPDSDTVWASTLKPLDRDYAARTVDFDSDTLKDVILQAATPEEKIGTIKVMGGEDWKLWIEALSAAGVLAPTCRTVAYSYIGSQLTKAIYRGGTIGAAKDHLEATARELHQRLSATGGGAWVSVNKALVTQASSAIPLVPLYIALLYKVMKARGTHEECGEQIVRLFRDHLAPGKTPVLDEQHRIRVDDWELDPAVQSEVTRLWEQVNNDNLTTIGDYAGYKLAFLRLFGFEVPGVDYAEPVELEAALV